MLRPMVIMRYTRLGVPFCQQNIIEYIWGNFLVAGALFKPRGNITQDPTVVIIVPMNVIHLEIEFDVDLPVPWCAKGLVSAFIMYL